MEYGDIVRELSCLDEGEVGKDEDQIEVVGVNNDGEGALSEIEWY